MPYSLLYRPHAARQMQWISLTRQGRIALAAFVNDYLKTIPDDFRLNPANRGPDRSEWFSVTFLLRDNGKNFAVTFVVDDSSAASGVLRVDGVYCELGH